jgi:large subunit ribosomal protein L21
MYAVIETGGKQYRVEVGTELEVELLDVEPGQSITLDRVLLVADGADAAVGTPVVENAAVEADVVGATRGEKVIAFKYRPKARRRVKKGHRQDLTVLRIADIRFNGKSAAEGVAKSGSDKAATKAKLEEAAARQAAEDAALAAKLAAKAEPRPVEKAEPKPKATKKATPAVEPLVEAPAEPTVEEDAAPEAKAGRPFEIFEDKAGEWRWRLLARNGEPLARSEQGFSSKSSVVRTLDSVRRNAAEAESHTEVGGEGQPETATGFEIYEGKAGDWRWRLRASNGELVAVPEQGFSSKSGVVRALEVVRRNVAAAEGHQEATTDETSADAAPKRARTKKDE